MFSFGSEAKKFQLLGEITFLLTASPLHQKAYVGKIRQNIFPPLELNQFRIYRTQNQPVGFVAWAYLSDEIEQQFIAGPMELQPEDWKSGDNLFFIEFIAPFGHTRQILRDLTTNIFPDRVAKSLRFKKFGKPPKLCRFHGKAALRPRSQFSSESAS